MTAGQPSGAPGTAERLVVRYFEELINDGRSDHADEFIGEAYVEHAIAPFETVEPGAVHGPTLMATTLGWLRGQFPDLRFRIEAIVAQGDLVAARVIGEGTNRGPIGPHPATGRRFSAASSHWFRVAGCRLVEHWATRDDLTTMLQLGLVHGPGPRPAEVAETEPADSSRSGRAGPRQPGRSSTAGSGPRRLRT